MNLDGPSQFKVGVLIAIVGILVVLALLGCVGTSRREGMTQVHYEWR